jgi:hypothetical protein
MENGKIDRSGSIHSIYIYIMATADKLIRMDLKNQGEKYNIVAGPSRLQ